MRDVSVDYGVNCIAETDVEGAKSLARSAWSFAARHGADVESEEDLAWILGDATPSFLELGGPNGSLDYLHDLGFNRHRPLNRLQLSLDSKQKVRKLPVEPKNVKTVHECPFDASVEIGSLKMLRTPQFKAYFDHLDSAGTFLHNHVADATVKALGASLLLPRSSIWRINQVACDGHSHAYCLPPDTSTAAMDRKRRRFLAWSIAGDHLGWTDAMLEGSPRLGLWQQYWEFITDRLEEADLIDEGGRGHTAYSNHSHVPWYEERDAARCRRKALLANKQEFAILAHTLPPRPTTDRMSESLALQE